MSISNITITDLATFKDHSENDGVINSGVFQTQASNAGEVVSGNFANNSINTGVVDNGVFADNSTNTSTGSVATGTFSHTSTNQGSVTIGTFTDNSKNDGTATSASFSGTSQNTNLGVVVNGSFASSSTNFGTVSSGSFADSSTNTGAVSSGTFISDAANTGVVESASFTDSAINRGFILLQATFTATASNISNDAQGTIIFSGQSVNTAVIPSAIFQDHSTNYGTVTLSATFTDTSINHGAIGGDAVFLGSSTNTGVVSGDFYSDITNHSNNTGTVIGFFKPYVQPDGYFIYGYFLNGVKTAPADYLTTVHQIDNTWYMYDSIGAASLATGVFYDGTDLYTFKAGVKEAIYYKWFNDTSGQHHLVKVNGTVTQSNEGNGVRAAQITGTDNYITTDIAAISADNYTVEMFFNTTGFQADSDLNPLLTINDGIAYGIVLGIDPSNNLYASQSNITISTSNATISNNLWNHIAIVRDSAVVSLYLNGLLIGGTVIGDELNHTNVTICATTVDRSRPFSGKIAGVRVVKGTALYSENTYSIPHSLLTAVQGTQLLLNFEATATPKVGFWYSDTSAAAHTVTIHGNVTQSDEGNGVKAATFNGDSSNSITLAETEDFAFGTGDFTIEAFVNQNNTNRQNWFVFGTQANDNNRLQFLYTGGNIGYYHNRVSIASAPFNLKPGVWYHVALSRNNGVARVFVNGVKIAQNNDTVNYSTNDFRISDLEAGPSGINGKITNVRIIKGSALYINNFIVSKSLSTAVSGTQLLLTFNATNVPDITNWYDDTSKIRHFITQNGQVNLATSDNSIFYADFANGTLTLDDPIVNFGTNDFTIEFFAKDISSNARIMGSNIDDNNRFSFFTDESNGNFQFVFAGFGTQPNINNADVALRVPGPNPFTDGAWKHVALTCVNGVIKLFFNGKFIDSVNRTTGFTGFTHNFQIGNYTNFYYPYTAMQGKIAALRIINGTALYTRDFDVPTTLLTPTSQTQLLLNFTATAVPSTIPISYWYYDQSSIQHTVAINGGVTQVIDDNNVVAAQFDGTSGYLEIANTTNLVSNLGTGDFTLEMFIKTTTPSLDENIRTIFVVQSNGGLVAFIHKGSFCYGVVGQDLITSPPNIVNNGKWHHVAIVRNTNITTLYLDGISVGIITDNNDLSSNDSVSIGYNYFNPAYFSGSITGLRLTWSAVYYNNFPVPTSLPKDISNTKLLLTFGGKVVPTKHRYAFNNYFADVEVLADGIILYTSLDSDTVASNVTFAAASNTITTNELGVVSLSELWYSDGSSKPYTLIANGNIIQTDLGNGVKVATFNGDTDYFTTDAGDLEIGDFTVELFFKTTKLLNTQTFIGNRDWRLEINGSFVYFAVDYYAAKAVQANKWYHLATSRSGTSVYTFLNGQRIGSITTHDDSFVNTQLGIGSYLDLTGQQLFQGSIASIRITNTALYTNNFIIPATLPTAVSGTKLLLNFGSTAALAKHVYSFDQYFADSNTLADGTVLYSDLASNDAASNITFDTSTKTVITDNQGQATLIDFWYKDTSSLSYSITKHGNVKWSYESNGVKAAEFGGNIGDYLSTKDNISIGQGDFTAEFFVKKYNDDLNFNNGNGNFISQSVGGFQFGHFLNTMWYSKGGYINLLTTSLILDTNWHHFAVVKNHSGVNIYLDGISILSGNDYTDFGSSPVNIGAAPWANQYLHGKIASLRITNTAVYSNKFAIPTTLLTAITGTQLLMNFGATAVPTKHAYAFNKYFADVDTLANGVVLYTTLDGNTVAANITFDTATNTVTTDSLGVAALSELWYKDTSSMSHTVVVNGTVVQDNLGSGVKVAAFNGSSNFTVSDLFTNTGTGNFTVETFFKLNSDNGHAAIFGSNDSGKLCLVQYSDKLEIGLIGTGIVATAYGTTLNTNWNHVAIVRNNTTITLYYNGKAVASSSSYGAYNFSTSNPVDIGGIVHTAPLPPSPTYYSMNGSLAGFRVTNTAVYTNDFPIPTTVPTAVEGTQLLLNFGATAVPTKHAYVFDKYFADVDTLSDGVVLYTTLDGNTVAANKTFTTTANTITTDSSGVVTVVDLWYKDT